MLLCSVVVVLFENNNSTQQVTNTMHNYQGVLQMGFSDQSYDQKITDGGILKIIYS